MGPTPGLTPAEAQAAVDPVAIAGAKRMRRIILIVLVVLSLAAVTLGVTWHRTGLWNPSWGARDGAVCPVHMVQPADPADVKVNVYNGSVHDGIGATTAEALSQRGFQDGSVANAKLDDRVRSGAGVIVTGPGTTEEALAVQRQVPTAKILIQPGRSDGLVDLILGDGFQGLQAKKRVSDAPGRLDCVRQAFPG